VLVLLLPGTSLGASLAAKLTMDAQAALIRGNVSRAAVLLRGSWEISHDIGTLQQLAHTYTMAGQFAEAIEKYEQLLRLNPPPEIAKLAKTTIRRLREAPVPFTDSLLVQVHVPDKARLAFAQGMRLVKAKKLDQATHFLRAALVLDPTLPGTYRVLGAIHGKLNDPAKEREFLQDYLRIRPDGHIADIVRKRLQPTGLLYAVDLSASFPCDVWVNGRPLKTSTPVKGLLLPGGNHTVSFVNTKYHIIRNQRVHLGNGTSRKQTVLFEFGVLEVTLKKPWPRIRADGKDLGLWEAVGMPVGRYSINLEAFDGSRKKQVSVSIRAGKTVTISEW